jgi:large repetitive protein
MAISRWPFPVDDPLMRPTFSTRRMRVPSVAARRLAAGVTTAALFVLALPVPATAAPTPSVTITDVTVPEGNAGTVNATFTIQVAPRPRNCCPLQVSWATAPGSATAPADYTTSSGTVSLSRAVSTRTVSVPIVGDAIDESNETFVVNLTNLVGTPGQIGDAQGVATITDDDPLPTISINDASVTEGNAGTTTATFTASLSSASGKTVTVDWATAPGTATAGTDYVAASGSRTIAAGATGTTIAVTVNGDVLDEVNETFGLTLSNPGNATIADGSGLGTITDDDPLSVLSINDVSVTEGNAGTTTATFTVSLSAASAKTVTVDWATADGSATQPGDYAAGSGTVTFVPGDATETIAVTVNGDLTAELDESFRVVLSAPSNADLGDAEALGTIVDDELLPVIDIDEPTLAEGQSGPSPVTFSVTLSHPAAWTVTVDWDTVAGTATEGIDYAGASGTVTFAPTDTSETVQVTVNGDGTFEPDETFALDLSNASGAPIGDPQGIATIANDDDVPVLSVTDVSVAEGNAGTRHLGFVVSLTGASDVDASVDFATVDGTATGGADFVAASGTLVVPAGETSGVVDVVVKGDVAYEATEHLSLALSNPSIAVIGDGTARGTIVNDDKMRTTVTLRAVRKPRTVLAKGLLEPTKAGHRVTATLFRKQHGTFRKIAAKTVKVRSFRDRDGDGKTDGAYTATFLRPKPAGVYRIIVRFKGSPTHRACKRARVFKLPPR